MNAQGQSPDPFNPDGKTAIVTGGGSGINFEFAQLLLSRGCNVVIGDLSLRPEAEALLEKYQSKPRAVFYKTDVTNWTDLTNLFDTAKKEFGTFDVVCPGAGIFEPHWSNFWHPPGAENSASKDPVDGHGHYATLDINLTHPIRATQLAIAEFINPANGAPKASFSNPKRVVHLSSMAGQVSGLPFPMYVATKHGLMGFVRSLDDLDKTFGIRCNGICPGLVRTPLWTEHPEKMININQEQDEWTTPREVAEGLLRLIEDPEMVGGTFLEVGIGHARVVPQFNNEGPKGARGLMIGKISESFKEVYEWLGEKGFGRPKLQN